MSSVISIDGRDYKIQQAVADLIHALHSENKLILSHIAELEDRLQKMQKIKAALKDLIAVLKML
jgi:hypothetical protein